MDERTDQVVGEILEERQRLGDSVAELERKVKESTSWRGYFARKPWIALGLAPDCFCQRSSRRNRTECFNGCCEP